MGSEERDVGNGGRDMRNTVECDICEKCMAKSLETERGVGNRGKDVGKRDVVNRERDVGNSRYAWV